MLVVIAHPYGGKPELRERAKRWLGWSARAAQFIREETGEELFVCAPWIPLTEVLPETAEDRRYGIRATLQLFAELGSGQSIIEQAAIYAENSFPNMATDFERGRCHQGCEIATGLVNGTWQKKPTLGLWCFSGLSTGVKTEASACLHHGGEAWDFTLLGDEPPSNVFDPRMHPVARWMTRARDIVPEWWRVVEEKS